MFPVALPGPLNLCSRVDVWVQAPYASASTIFRPDYWKRFLDPAGDADLWEWFTALSLGGAIMAPFTQPGVSLASFSMLWLTPASSIL